MLRVNDEDLDVIWVDGNYVPAWEGKPFTGIAFELRKNGQLSEEIEYVDGVEISRKSWHENGQLAGEMVSEDSCAFIREWLVNGQIMAETTMVGQH